MNVDLQRYKDIINQCLSKYQVGGKVEQINFNKPYLSVFVKLEIGEKISRINTIENELALFVESKSLPVIKYDFQSGLVKIIFAVAEQCIVKFEQVVCKNNYQIPLYLGVDEIGENICIDLTTCPHILIGGTTGSGKTILLKNIIKSVILSDCDIILIDPKRSEFAEFNYYGKGFYCYNYQETLAVVCDLVDIMENRYQLFQQYQCNNLQQLNQLLQQNNQQCEDNIVLVIDELADLFHSDNNNILRDNTIKLIQKARAIGIFCIFATQRPSREVLDGLIKANIPTRIALKVASAVDSRIILDSDDAEKLIGCGDMIVKKDNKYIRGQAAYG